MSERTKNTEDLEIDEDLRFQHKEWKFQRIGMIALFIMLFLSILGLLGHGLFNHAEVSAGAFKVEYENIVRREQLFKASIIVDDISNIKDSLTVKINHDFCEEILVDFIMPEPVKYEISDNSYNLVFSLKDAAAPVRIYLQMKHDEAGTRECRITIPGKGEVSFNQIILP